VRAPSPLSLAALPALLLAACDQSTLPVDIEIDPEVADFATAARADDGWRVELRVTNRSTTQAVFTAWRFEGEDPLALSIPDDWRGARLDPEASGILTVHLAERPPEGATGSTLLFDATAMIGLGERREFSVPVRVDALPDDPFDPCDEDADGFDALSCGGDDCDDAEPLTFPGAEERCNGLDDDCDGARDNGLPVDLQGYADADADGFGDPDTAFLACAPVDGLVPDGGDCDDADADVFPGALETCNDRDDDCDESVDEEAVDAATWFSDVDTDGFGDPAAPALACAQPEGAVAEGDDCDDTAAEVFPGAPERCNSADDDCDGAIDEDAVDAPLWPVDADGDGFGHPTEATAACALPPGHAERADDCDDARAEVFPGAPERCNSADDDCDGTLDEDAVDPLTFFADRDGDGFGNAADTLLACAAAPPFVTDATDCDDSSATVSPASAERCNGVDDDCDGTLDEDAVDAPVWNADADGDGFGDPASVTAACVRPPGFVADTADCDDARADVFPGALERCNGIDDNCNFGVDEQGAVDGALWYVDLDGDTFGSDRDVIRACVRPPAYRDNNLDCDDDEFQVKPTAIEACNEIDDNCNGLVDEDSPSSLFWYLDTDGDGFGVADEEVQTCAPPPGYVAEAGDCDPDDPTFHPRADEWCDNLDHDCDGLVNEVDSLDAEWFYLDSDGDGFGDAANSQRLCSPAQFLVADDTDCDDSSDLVFPGAPELCNDADDDCDGVSDNDPVDATAWYADLDGDGYGDPLDAEDACDPIPGRLDDDQDCDDTDPAVSPDGIELCNGVDDDCDGTVDNSGLDSDGDGVDNCVDPTVYTQVFDDVSGGQSALESLGWKVADFAFMDCCGATPLPAPAPAPPAPANPPNWQIDTDGTLSEMSNAAHSVAFSPDLGALPEFTLRTDVGSAGVNNDAAGLFFAYRDTNDFWLIRWDNPYGSYPRYGATGSMDLIRCEPAGCRTLVSTNGGLPPSVAGVLDAFAVHVSGGLIDVEVNGLVVLSFDAGTTDPIGPHAVGAYAFDTDAGVIYDNFEVVQP
jgi:hypothetical protein